MKIGSNVLTVVLLWMLALPEAVNFLHKRAHELVVIKMQTNATLSNYTEINLSLIKIELYDKTYGNYLLSTPKWEIEKILWFGINIFNRKIFEHSQIRRLYAPVSNEKFDLVIIDGLCGAALFSFAHRFRAPLIDITTAEMYQYTRYLLGEFLLPSFPSNWEFDTNAGFNLSFWQRTANSTCWPIFIAGLTSICLNNRQKYLGVDAGDLYDTTKNISLFFTTRSNTFANVKPEVPNIISFNSVHIMKEPPSLPKNLKHFLDGATEGFVYMSFGSTFNSSLVPKEKLNAMFNAFLKLPYRVLWKFHEENLPEKPDNVFIMKWIPQQGVLAHPNIKVFVYQGGLQSTDEAIHYAVPLVGIPIMYDQGYIINKLVEKGVARRLDYRNLSDTDLVTAIRNVFGDKRYKENMILLSELTKDKLIDDIDSIIWWIKYVMRHNGAPHLRYNGANLPFYKRYDTDIIAFFAVIMFTITIILLFVLVKCLYFIVRSRILINTTYKSEFCRDTGKEKTS